jgi:hypothetical protein
MASVTLRSGQRLVGALDQERAQGRIGGDIRNAEAERGKGDDAEDEPCPKREAREHQLSAASSM